MSPTDVGLVFQGCDDTSMFCKGKGRVRGLPGQARVLVCHHFSERGESVLNRGEGEVEGSGVGGGAGSESDKVALVDLQRRWGGGGLRGGVGTSKLD